MRGLHFFSCLLLRLCLCLCLLRLPPLFSTTFLFSFLSRPLSRPTSQSLLLISTSCSATTTLYSRPYSITVARPMPTICIGSLKDIEGCNCNLFIPRKSKKNKCKSCGHQKVSHSDIPTTPPPRGTKVDTTAMAKPQGHSKYTDRLYKSLKATAVHEDARKETLQGFRPPSPPTMVCAASMLKHYVH